MVATVHPALPDSPSPSDLKTFGRRSRRFVWAKVSGGKTDIVRSEPSKGDQTILHEIFSASDAPAQIERHRRQRSSTVSAAGGPVVPASLDEEARLAALHKPSGLAKRHGRSRSIFFRKNPTSKAGSATAESSAPSGRSRCATEQAQSDMEDAISFGSLASPRSASVTKALRDLEQVSDFVCHRKGATRLHDAEHRTDEFQHVGGELCLLLTSLFVCTRFADRAGSLATQQHVKAISQEQRASLESDMQRWDDEPHQWVASLAS
ncbi:hypothetical protein CBOM_00948 [Ceraceosorus bombacis]|uniref:Uncharacterized protein n=1 Tax=Ceraceosorus bombacis TaxID=401625 RepID=A0A0P1BB95_9BASI|nr:hypothetical protein CBOM_00948 [Ceraceosorus bombacis]